MSTFNTQYFLFLREYVCKEESLLLTSLHYTALLVTSLFIPEAPLHSTNQMRTLRHMTEHKIRSRWHRRPTGSGTYVVAREHNECSGNMSMATVVSATEEAGNPWPHLPSLFGLDKSTKEELRILLSDGHRCEQDHDVHRTRGPKVSSAVDIGIFIRNGSVVIAKTFQVCRFLVVTCQVSPQRARDSCLVV